MSKKHLCKSCSGPLDEFPKEEIIKEGFCPYCVNKEGTLKSYGDILKGMLEYIKAEHKEIKERDHLSTAQKWLREGEVWKDKFVSNDIVIDSFRDGNLREIGSHRHETEGFEHSCAECMYYQGYDDNLEKREKWLEEMQQKYGACGNLLYYKGKLVGFAQYAPQKEFHKLEKLKQENSKDDIWYISCIYINPKTKSSLKKKLVKLFLEYIIKSLKSRKIKLVEISAALQDGTISSIPYSWKFYEDIGFKKTSEDKEYAVGVLNL